MENKYTLIWINNKNALPKEFNLSVKKFKKIFTYVAIIVSITFILIVFSIFQIFQYNHLIQLEKENQILRKELSDIDIKLDDFESNINDLIQSEKNLRMIAGLYDIPEEVRQLGHGGNYEIKTDHLNGINKKVKTDLISINQKMELLVKRANLEQMSYRQITDKLQENKDETRYIPAIKPTRGWISSGYGKRMHPIHKKIEFHKGIDIACPKGLPILAPADGVVSFVGRNGGYGKMVKLNHNNKYKTVYAHMDRYNVKKGQVVSRYDIIGYVGNTGSSTAPHLHYEVLVKNERKYKNVNPYNYLLD